MESLEDFVFMLRSHLTAFREKVEDPERMLHQWICDQEEELERLRHLVANVMADEAELSRCVDAAAAEAGRWRAKAAEALHRGDESAARAALAESLRVTERTEALRIEREALRGESNRLQESYRALEDEIRQARHRRTLLVARMAQAQTSGRFRREFERATGDSDFAEFSRLEREVRRAEAMSAAYDLLDGRDVGPETVDRSAERRRQLEAELDALRRRAGEEATGA